MQQEPYDRNNSTPAATATATRATGTTATKTNPKMAIAKMTHEKQARRESGKQADKQPTERMSSGKIINHEIGILLCSHRAAACAWML